MGTLILDVANSHNGFGQSYKTYWFDKTQLRVLLNVRWLKSLATS